MKILIYSFISAAILFGGLNYAWAVSEPEILSIYYPYYTAAAPVSFFNDNAMIMFYGPEEAVTLNLVIQPEPDRNLEQYTAFSREQIKNVPDFKVEKESSEVYSGVKFASAINNFKRNGLYLRSKCVWTVHNKHAYVMTFAAPERLFDKYLKTAEDIFASFKLSPLSISVPADFVPRSSIMMGFGESTSEGFRINFNIIVKPETGMSLEEFTEFSKSEASKIPGFTILKEGYETFGGAKFFSVVHKFKQNQISLKARSAWSLKDKKVYILTYTSTEKAYEKYAADIDYLCKKFIIK